MSFGLLVRAQDQLKLDELASRVVNNRTCRVLVHEVLYQFGAKELSSGGSLFARKGLIEILWLRRQSVGIIKCVYIL